MTNTCCCHIKKKKSSCNLREIGVLKVCERREEKRCLKTLWKKNDYN